MKGFALKFASVELRSDREIGLAALAQNALAFQHASSELHLWRPWAWRAEEGRAGAGFALLEPARPLLLTQASLTQQKHDRNGSRDGQ